MKTFWLSFAGDGPGAGPNGGFLGVAIVQVDEVDAAVYRAQLLPQSKPNAEWVLAATAVASEMGCNPGGHVMAFELPAPPPGVRLNRLLTREEALAAQRDMRRDPPPRTEGS